MPIFVPPSEVFEIPPKAPQARAEEGTYDIPGVTGKLTRSKDGEMMTIFDSFPHPRKGAVYEEAILANNEVKRRTLSTFTPFACKEMVPAALGFLVIPFSWKIRFLEKLLRNYAREVDGIYLNCTRVPYLKKEYYNNCSKALWDVVSVFMRTLGFSGELADKVGKIFATLLEYDDAYKCLFEDPMSEFTKAEVIKDPIAFIKKFMRLVKDRDIRTEVITTAIEEIPKELPIGTHLSASGKMLIEFKVSPIQSITHKKFHDFGRLLTFALYHPKIKKAFRKAISQSKFEWLQLDEIERFWNLNRYDYNLQGRPFLERYNEYINILGHHLQQLNKADAMELSMTEHGTFTIKPLYTEEHAKEMGLQIDYPLTA